MTPTLLVHDLQRLYTMDPDREGLGMLENAAVAFSDDQVVYVGPTQHAPTASQTLDGSGLLGMPGLVDPHTHAIWAGSRADEFGQRLAGASYAEILEGGGGILSTVAATRNANLGTLTQNARERLRHLRAQGVTTVEVKSGYGLNPEVEQRLLQAANACSDTTRIVPTFLGAHTIPAEWRSDREAYVRQIIEEQIPLCAPHARFVDVYCDRGAFTLEEGLAILEAGKAAGLGIKAHAEQVTHTGIAAAAAAIGATSLEHLEHIDDAGIAAMADHRTIAVLLPGAQLYLRDVAPPVAALREAGVPMAVGSDLNPGSSPVHDLWTAATLSCLLQGLTIEEAALGITRTAGEALARNDLGWLGSGSVADLALFAPPPGEPATIESLIQHLGRNQASVVILEGQQVI